MKIYFAGPDVFRPDYLSFAEKTGKLCSTLGLEGLWPGLDGISGAKEICAFNLGLLRQADCVAANLNPFRGLEPDSGTVFECGFAFALGKPVYGWLNDLRDTAEKIRTLPPGSPEKRIMELDGTEAEDFGLPLNLMLSCTLSGIFGGLGELLSGLAGSSASV